MHHNGESQTKTSHRRTQAVGFHTHKAQKQAKQDKVYLGLYTCIKKKHKEKPSNDYHTNVD